MRRVIKLFIEWIIFRKCVTVTSSAHGFNHNKLPLRSYFIKETMQYTTGRSLKRRWFQVPSATTLMSNNSVILWCVTSIDHSPFYDRLWSILNIRQVNVCMYSLWFSDLIFVKLRETHGDSSIRLLSSYISHRLPYVLPIRESNFSKSNLRLSLYVVTIIKLVKRNAMYLFYFVWWIIN